MNPSAIAIKRAVQSVYGMTSYDLTVGSGKPGASDARKAMVYAMRHLASRKRGWQEIARSAGYRSHTGAMAAYRRAVVKLRDPEFQRELAAVLHRASA